MDLSQNKLTKKEWNSIEKPVDKNELNIINLIKNGFSDTNLTYNSTLTLLSYLKITFNKNIDLFIYVYYIQDEFK